MKVRMNQLLKDLDFKLAAMAIAAIIFVFYSLYVIFNSNPNVQAAIIAGTVALITIGINSSREKNKSIREVHRDKKIEIYSKFYDVMFGLMTSNLTDKKRKELESQLSEVARGIMFYGSPAVINSYAIFKSGDHADYPTMFIRVGRLLLSMREDIGLSNENLDEITIHQIYIRDDLHAIMTTGQSATGSSDEHP